MFNHITLQWVQFFRLLFLYTDIVPQTWLFGQLKYLAVFTLLWFLLNFYYFYMCLSWRPLVGMVSHKSGYQLCLCDRCSFTQKVLQDRTLHSHLVKCNWDEFLLLGLPTHNLRLWMVAYNLYLWEVAKALCYNFRFCPHSFKQWRSVGRNLNFSPFCSCTGFFFYLFLWLF